LKIRTVEAELFHDEGWTDTTKLIAAFCNFANAPKNTSVFTSQITLGITTETQLFNAIWENNRCLLRE